MGSFKQALPVGVTALATAAVLGGAVGAIYATSGGDDTPDAVTVETVADETTPTTEPSTVIVTAEPEPVETVAPAPVEEEPVQPQPVAPEGREAAIPSGSEQAPLPIATPRPADPDLQDPNWTGPEPIAPLAPEDN